VILVSVAAVSLIAFVGILFIGLKETLLSRIVMALVGFASGALIGGAFIHLLPESLQETGQDTFYYVIVGIILFFVMESSYIGDIATRKRPSSRFCICQSDW
jgi:zinc and cadmium transporter